MNDKILKQECLRCTASQFHQRAKVVCGECCKQDSRMHTELRTSGTQVCKWNLPSLHKQSHIVFLNAEWCEEQWNLVLDIRHTACSLNYVSLPELLFDILLS